jgi:mRNA interferase RelE/StbE
VKVVVSEAFQRDVRKLHNRLAEDAVLHAVKLLNTAAHLRDLSAVVAIQGKPHYFRYRVGSYRLGFTFRDGTLTLLRCLHRREAYRFFP